MPTKTKPAIVVTPQTALNPVTVLALSPEDAARALGIARTKVFALLASGAIRSVKIGRHRRIPVAAIEAFLARETEPQGA